MAQPGVLIGENRTVGALPLVGMSAVVTHDVLAPKVWVGWPTRQLRPSISPGAHVPGEKEVRSDLDSACKPQRAACGGG